MGFENKSLLKKSRTRSGQRFPWTKYIKQNIAIKNDQTIPLK